jgi:hypothetical protein
MTIYGMKTTVRLSSEMGAAIEAMKSTKRMSRPTRFGAN